MSSRRLHGFAAVTDRDSCRKGIAWGALLANRQQWHPATL